MNQGEINIYEIISIINRKKFIIFSITSIFVILSLIYAFSTPNKYSSHALLAPSDDSNSSEMLGQLGGFANLAGLSLDESGDKTDEAIERIKSFEFFKEYILNESVLVDLMAAKGWNSSDKKVIYDSNKYDLKSGKWVRKSFIPFTSIPNKPSTQEAYKYFKNMLFVSQNSSTGFTELSVTHFSPHVAQRWCENIIININKSMREEERLRVQNSIDFLNEQYKNSNYKELKVAASSLVEEQMKSLMFVEASESFVFKVIDSPIVSEFKSSPKRLIILIAGFIFGLLTSSSVILFNHYKQN